jgi:hypothetical protein
MKRLDELRSSDYHRELGQKMWAAFLAQQQGISLNSAVKKFEGPVGDGWLLVADFALQVYNGSVERILSEPTDKQSKHGPM